MHRNFVQLGSRADPVPGLRSNVVGIPPTSAAKREDWILYSTNKPIQSDDFILRSLLKVLPRDGLVKNYPPLSGNRLRS